MAADWQVPTELPDLRRVEHRRAGHRDEGKGWQLKSRIRLACRRRISSAASALPTAKITAFARIISRCAIPIPKTSIREQVFRWLKDLIASDVRFVTQNGLV